jgi:hypothetical protein
MSKAKSQSPFNKSPGNVQDICFHPSRPYLFIATQQHVKVFHLVEQKASLYKIYKALCRYAVYFNLTQYLFNESSSWKGWWAGANGYHLLTYIIQATTFFWAVMIDEWFGLIWTCHLPRIRPWSTTRRLFVTFGITDGTPSWLRLQMMEAFIFSTLQCTGCWIQIIANYYPYFRYVLHP